MASTTWVGGDSGNETDWATGANWSTGSPPTTGAHVVIANTGHKCALDQNRTIGSLTIQASGTIIGGGHKLIVQSEGDASGGTEHFAVNNDGRIEGELNLEITTSATTNGDFAGESGHGKFHDVTINHASCIVNLWTTTQFTGNLNITLGKIVCGGNTVEITGRTDIGPASGSADQATLQCDASAMFLGSGRTSSFALVVNQGGTFTGGSGNHTIGSIETKNNSNAKCTLTSAVTTLDAESASDNYNLFVAANGTFAHGSGTVTITFAGVSFFEKTSGTLALNNLILNHASANITTNSATTVAGNLTITAGTLSTSGSGNYALTVTGLCTVNGTLTGNASAISIGGLLVGASGKYNATSGTTTVTAEDSTGYAWDVNGTDSFDNNDGGVTFDLGSGVDSHIRTGESDGDNSFHNVTVLLNASSNTLALRPNGGSAMTIEGNLTISEGKFYQYNDNYSLTVNGNVEVHSGGELGLSSTTGAISFGSLLIDGGGTYVATSGTTTITSESGAGYAANVDGTFTHNNGTLTITTPAHTYMSPITPYNLIINHSSANVRYTGAPDSTMTIANDLTITAGVFDPDDGNENLTVTGDVSIASGGTLGASDVTSAMSFGSLTIASGGTYNATSGTTTITGDPGGYPNIGINIDGTFTHNNGTLKYTGGGGAFDLSGTGNLYNFEHAPTATTFITTNTTIENNLTITGGNFQGANGNENLTVKGNVTINSSAKSLTFVGTSEHTFGFLTILDGTYKVQNDTGGFTKVGGIRNVGGTVSNAV